MKLYSPETIREMRERYGFQLSKSLGQNFLTDKNIVDAIIDATDIGSDDLVIEIGPGMGVITAEAAARAKKTVAVEIDRRLIPILEETLKEFHNVEIINADVLKTDLNGIIEREGFKTAKIIGNLPYYITTPIIMHLLEKGIHAESITVMMQKEVADRIQASPGGKTCGAITAAVNYYCTVTEVARVPRTVFVPAPKVDSTVLRFDLRKEKEVDLDDEKLFFRCIKAGFGQRRKTLLNSLGAACSLTKEQIGECLDRAGINPSRRAETLSIREFADIANSISEVLED